MTKGAEAPSRSRAYPIACLLRFLYLGKHRDPPWRQTPSGGLKCVGNCADELRHHIAGQLVVGPLSIMTPCANPFPRIRNWVHDHLEGGSWRAEYRYKWLLMIRQAVSIQHCNAVRVNARHVN